MPLYYAIGLLLVFYVLLVGEFFLPTGGLMGIAAAATAAAAIAIAFTHSTTAGIVMVMVIGATTPFVFMGAVRFWPHTPIGRRILNRRPGELNDGPQRRRPDGSLLTDLVGQVGAAESDLLPSGQVSIGGQKMNAVSTGMPIDRGTRIVVVKVIAGKVQVRPAEAEKSMEDDSTPHSPPSLESSLESLDVDLLE